MKKYLLLLIATFAFQFGQAQEFHFTPKIGMSFANLTNTDGSMAPGLNIGIAAEFPILEDFAIEPGIYYSMQGARSDVYVAMDDMLVDGDLTYDMDYLNIPIYAKYYVYDGFFIEAVALGNYTPFSKGAAFGADKTKEEDIRELMYHLLSTAGLFAQLRISAGYNF